MAQPMDPREQVGYWLATACSRHSLQADILRVIIDTFPSAEVLRLSFGLQNKTMVSVNIRLPLGTCHVSFIPIHPTAAAASVLQDTPTIVVRQPDKNSPLWDQEDLWQREKCATLTVVSMPFYWPPRDTDLMYGHALPRPQRPEHQPTFGAMCLGTPRPLPEQQVRSLLELAQRTGRHVCMHISALLAALEQSQCLPSEPEAQLELVQAEEEGGGGGGGAGEEDDIDPEALGFDAALREGMPPDLLGPEWQPPPPQQQAGPEQRPEPTQPWRQLQQEQEEEGGRPGAQPAPAGRQQGLHGQAGPSAAAAAGATAAQRAPGLAPLGSSGRQLGVTMGGSSQAAAASAEGLLGGGVTANGWAAGLSAAGEGKAGLEADAAAAAVAAAAGAALGKGDDGGWGAGAAALERQGSARQARARLRFPRLFCGYADSHLESKFVQALGRSHAKLDLFMLLLTAMVIPLLAFFADSRASSYPLRCMSLVAGPPLVLLLRWPDTYLALREWLLLGVAVYGAVCSASEAGQWVAQDLWGTNLLSLLLRATGLDYLLVMPLLLQVSSRSALRAQAICLCILLAQLPYILPGPSPQTADPIHQLMATCLLACGAAVPLLLLWWRERKLRRRYSKYVAGRGAGAGGGSGAAGDVGADGGHGRGKEGAGTAQGSSSSSMFVGDGSEAGMQGG